MTILANLVLESRSVLGGYAIEIDFDLNDKSLATLQVPFPLIPILQRAIWEAAATAETTQRQAAGERMLAGCGTVSGNGCKSRKFSRRNHPCGFFDFARSSADCHEC